MTKGYKATHNYKCLNQIYEIGQEYKLDQKPIVCVKGFHYCKNSHDVLNYYAYTHAFKLLEIEDLSNDTITDDDKSCSNHIRIVREITDEQEIINLLGYYCSFNENGELIKLVSDTGYWVTNIYNKYGQLLKTEDSTGYLCEYTYDSFFGKFGKELTRIESYPDEIV